MGYAIKRYAIKWVDLYYTQSLFMYGRARAYSGQMKMYIPSSGNFI